MLVASALTAPLEVLALMSGFLGLRSALFGFIALTRGKPGRVIADEMALAIATGFPTSLLVGIAGAVILLSTR